MSVADEVFALFEGRGSAVYFGEHVTITAHMLQAAHFAERERAPRALILAALLHDVGHLLQAVPDDLEDWHTDAHHEAVGAQWLATRMPPQICEPVRLHVPAKRYLCATDPQYVAQLSEASIVTLRLQGGPMTAAEIAHFRTEPFHREAVRVRKWDDLGKIAGLKTPPLAHFRALIEEFAL